MNVAQGAILVQVVLDVRTELSLTIECIEGREDRELDIVVDE